jgi:hypothetical protein
MAQRPTRQPSSYSPTWEPEIALSHSQDLQDVVYTALLRVSYTTVNNTIRHQFQPTKRKAQHSNILKLFLLPRNHTFEDGCLLGCKCAYISPDVAACIITAIIALMTHAIRTSKRQQNHTSPHGATTQKAAIFIVTAVRTSSHTKHTFVTTAGKCEKQKKSTNDLWAPLTDDVTTGLSRNDTCHISTACTNTKILQKSIQRHITQL